MPAISYKVRIERRRFIGLSEPLLPPQIVGHFPDGERTVLTIIAQEHTRQGICTLSINELAAQSACGPSTVKSAIRHGVRLRLLVRKMHARQLRLRIVSAKWLEWLSKPRSFEDYEREMYVVPDNA